ncbi:MAG: hypothetical protein FWD64_11780 [Acidobacteriaceae bacterium]|nr:hypothetical protein [Acidobacteriaceae bacterium]
MKKILWMLGGFGLATAYFYLRADKQPRPPGTVTQLARRLRSAWADHHTVA